MNTGVTLASLKLLGTVPFEIDALKIVDKGSDIRCFIDCNTEMGMLKGPVAFLAFNLLISSSISFLVIGENLKFSSTLSGIKSSGDVHVEGMEDAIFLPTFSLHEIYLEFQY